MNDRLTCDMERSDLPRRRWLAAARTERETERRDLLSTLIDAHQRAALLRTWIADFAPRAAAAKDAQLARLLGWAEHELAALDAVSDPQRLSDALRARNLFPQIDPLLDPLGDPPPAHIWAS